MFYNKKILVTGHTGFKGSWLTLWLIRLGSVLTGYALKPKTERDNYCLTGLSNEMKEHIADIRDKEKLFRVFKEEKPEIIFHLAAQPLVLDSYADPLYTVETNTIGTANVLEAFRVSDSAQLLIVITTDKVYENLETKQNYKENDRLGGADPYSASKASSEIIASAYIHSYFSINTNKKVATVRAGNVIGGGDWSDFRLVPDCIKAIEKDEEIIIRNPASTRPWQYVLEPLGGYLLLAEKMLINGNKFTGAWNFGPMDNCTVSVEDIAKEIINCYGKGKYRIKGEGNSFKESKFLSLDITKAKVELEWVPCFDIKEAIQLTVDWYKNYKNVNVLEFCTNQIKAYEEKWKLKN